MRPIQFVILFVALVAAAAAGVIAMNIARKPQVSQGGTVAPPAIKLEEVLVASADVGIGTPMSPDKLTWRPWPAEGLSSGFITRTGRPDAITELQGTLVRVPMMSGEPVLDAKLVRSDRGYLSAVLPKGMRAVAVKVDAASTAGGFILPNDRVDVILVKQTPGTNAVESETLLRNIRVLAIDQTIENDADVKSVVVAQDTATLELTPEQAELIAQAQQLGTIALSLRSIEDSAAETSSVEKRSSGVNVVRFGFPSRMNATESR
jgi:pilus assembly protein CpaB